MTVLHIGSYCEASKENGYGVRVAQYLTGESCKNYSTSARDRGYFGSWCPDCLDHPDLVLLLLGKVG